MPRHRNSALIVGQHSPKISLNLLANGNAARAQNNSRITGSRVKVIAPSDKHRHGTGFQVHIWLTLPPHENINVDNTASDDARHEHANVAIKDAFAAARRQVDALAQKN